MVAGFFNYIIGAFADAAGWFFQLGAAVDGWVWPLRLVAPVFYAIGGAFDNVVWGFLDFRTWALSIEQDLREFVSRIDVLALLRPLLNDLAAIWTWITDAASFVWNYIASWWTGVSQTVLGWINAAVQEVVALVNTVAASLADLRLTWVNFWVNIYPDLVHYLDLQAIIKSWFEQYEPAWRGWQDLRDQVVELFADPEQWLIDRIESMLERFW